MAKGIVLLIMGPSLIKWSSFLAIQAAKREAAEVYALLDGDMELSPEIYRTFVAIRNKARSEGVDFDFYTVSREGLEASLMDILKQKKAFQVVVGVSDKKEIASAEAWLRAVETKLKADSDWYYPSLRFLVVATPNDPEGLEFVERYFQD
ncbi:hypothetical protein G4V39_08605 [Thermosulfuriphilus ammonigenes]|uniref:Uncharacterized protein n=1 Tax=Thermosulfuriphilus ammonigenes TaxID=1936021 RepID=A0A6G7PXL3_9BACT|nr:hypothetical protein [Thermosulfuriphilus ammonigenes]MBA2849567.1 hypothetical protein [Thermosulfuriphilus ammonigenes]QIJ72327.1 hypothetical protein G4V39_08605 [Thermosulfuriphilus ammonigenes]